MGLLARVKNWVASEDVAYDDLNAEFDNILDNLTTAYVDDYSANASQMQTTVDPGEVGSESLATTLAGEISRLRHMLKEITGEDEWYESPVASLIGLSNAIGTGLTANRLVSGRVVSAGTNDQPIFLVASGTATTATVKGSTTNFIYYVDGVEYTISTDVTLTGLTTAPSSNNTCLVNDAQAADDTYTKYTGEDGSIIPVDNMGTEISALVGQYAGFKLAGVGTEYFIAYVESSTALSKAYRGYFFDSSDARSARTGYTNNDTITLMKLTWVFAKSDGTLTATYNNPVWSKDQPSSPAIGDYWYDIANQTWKVYGVGSYSAANAQLVGVCIQDTSNCVGARSFEFFANYADLNTYEIAYDSATQVKSRFPGSVASVWGNTVKADRANRTWSMTVDLDSGVTEAASTYYYAYLTNTGDVVLSDVKPHDRREDLQGYYHPGASWRCLGSFFNDGSQDIDANSVNSYYTRQPTLPLKEASAALHVEVIDKVIRFSGNTASEYLPPAAKTKGQEILFVHGGTSLTQIYTLTTFGSETFTSNGSTTYALHTAGESLRVYSDGVGYVVLTHHSNTDWTVFTPTFAAGWGTVTNHTNASYWSRTGRDIKLRYYFTSGNMTGTAALTISVPVTQSSTIATNELVGSGQGNIAGANTSRAIHLLGVASDTYFNVGIDYYGSTTAGLTPINANTTGASVFNGRTLSIPCWQVPVTGWEP